MPIANVIFVIFGTLVSIGAGALAIQSHRFRQSGVKAVGIVRGRKVETSPEPGGGTMSAVTVTVEFEDNSGSKRQSTTPVITGTSICWKSGPEFNVKRIGMPDFAIGDAVTIIYDPDQPEHMRVDSWVERWLWVLVMSIMGVAFIGVGLMI